MTFWQFLNHWWNLPYLVMLGLVGVFFAMQAVGIFADAAGSDHEADVDGSAETADHDPGLDHQTEERGAKCDLRCVQQLIDRRVKRRPTHQ